MKLETFEVERTLQLLPPDGSDYFMEIGAAGDGTRILVTGMVRGPDESSYTGVVLIDATTLEVQGPERVGPNVMTFSVVPSDGRFYLLNITSREQSPDSPNDLLQVTPGTSPAVEPMKLAPSPTWGAVHGRTLYSFHDATWSTLVDESRRWISRMDLDTHEVQTWEVSADWRVTDVGFVGEDFYVLREGMTDGGLYRFDPATGKLERKVDLGLAYKLLLP